MQPSSVEVIDINCRLFTLVRRHAQELVIIKHWDINSSERPAGKDTQLDKKLFTQKVIVVYHIFIFSLFLDSIYVTVVKYA